MWILPPLLCLNYLLKLQSLQSMRLFINAKQPNIGFVRVRSQADILSHWSSFQLRSAFQLSHILKLLFTEGMWRRNKDKKGKSAGICQSKKSTLRSAFDWYPNGTKRKKMTSRVCWTSCIRGRSLCNKDPAPQQLKTLKSHCHHIFLPCFSLPCPLVFTTAWRPLLCSLLWFVQSFLCI